jgi:divalent metal cation (Fe/Co/Zn/Cd) transporter
MNKAISLALLVIGVALIVFGVISMDSFSSDVSRFFTGTPTDKAVWMLIAGIVAAIVGLSGITFFRSKD